MPNRSAGPNSWEELTPSMLHRYLNLKTQFVGLLVLLLLGALVVQSYVHKLNQERLTAKIEELVQEVADKLMSEIKNSFGVPVVLDAKVVRRVGNKVIVLKEDFQLSIDREVFVALANLLRSGALYPPETFATDLPARPPVLPSAPTEAWSEVAGEADVAEYVRQGADRRAVNPIAGLTIPLRARSSALGVATHAREQEIDITPYLGEVQALTEEYRRLDILATVGIFIFGIGVALFMGVRLTRPIYQVVDAFRSVAEGNLDTRVAPERLSGEFAVLGGQFNQMVESIQENQALERELEQRERVQHMGDLAAGVAHDVRNPLNAIHLNIGQVRDEFLPADPRARERFLRFTADAQTEVKRLNALISDFLSLAQPGSAAREAVSPNELLQDLERLIHKEASSRNVTLRLELDPNAPSREWVRQEMKSAFLNVAMNALQAMEPGGGSLDILTGVRPASGVVGGQEFVVTFVDTGHGIAAENLDKVFIPYFTLRSGGTGLGLPIARRIAERNGGRMELRSRVGEGTSVSFIFVDAPRARLAESPERSESGGTRAA
ncbi:MAG: ATP-binding protein [Planctomycetota bacterium]